MSSASGSNQLQKSRSRTKVDSLVWLAFFTVVWVGVTVWSFLVPDAVGFQKPAFARVFFWHFPFPIVASVLQGFAFFYSIRILLSKDDNQARSKWDISALATSEFAFGFVLLTLASGVVFSLVQWGTWWQRDPRQESYLQVTILSAVYFLLRLSLPAGRSQSVFGAAYCILTYLPIQFLTYIYPRLPQVRNNSFHPTTSIMEGQIKGQYAMVIAATLTLVSIFAYRMVRDRILAAQLLLAAQQHEDERQHVSRVNPTRPAFASDAGDGISNP